MNDISKTIGWAQKSWNPVTGCLNNCSYCYARRIANRFTGHFNPTLHLDRLEQPLKTRKGCRIFVCSMADLFGKWVPREWILKVLDVCKRDSRNIFMFLTKNPKRYLEFDFHNNCILGLTIDTKNRESKKKLKIFKKVAGLKFISFEPILSDMSGLNLNGIHLCIIGADSSRGAEKPKQEWIDSIKHDNIFYKRNVR